MNISYEPRIKHHHPWENEKVVTQIIFWSVVEKGFIKGYRATKWLN